MHLKAVVLIDKVVEIGLELRRDGIFEARGSHQALLLEQSDLSLKLRRDRLDFRLELTLSVLQMCVLVL